MKLALFDLDHTLLPIDSDQSWGQFTTTLGWTDAEEFTRKNDGFYADYQAGTLDIHDYVRFATEAFRIRPRAEAEAAHARFMQEVIWPVIRPEALALLKKHRDAGEQLLIITATNEFVTRPIANALGVDELIAVELVRDAEGWYSGEISGVPSLREGKVERLQQWLHQRGLDWDKVETTFYSDSSNDIPLLERVNHPVATNPDAKLKAVAIARGWPITMLGRDQPDTFRATLAQRFGMQYQRLSDAALQVSDLERDGVDLILECTGSDELMVRTTKVLRSCGVMVWLGSLKPERPPQLDVAGMMLHGLLNNHLHIGCVNSAPRDFIDAITHLGLLRKTYWAELQALITARVSLQDSLWHYQHREAQGIKTIIEYSS